jgi:hypothetical protein
MRRARWRAGLWIAVVGGLAEPVGAQPAAPPVAIPARPSPAPSAPPIATCSAAFHQALEPIRSERSPALGNVLTVARRADPDLTGRWLFAAALFPAKGRPAPAPKPVRECVETKSVRGQDRCARWETKPPPPPPAEIRTKAPPAAEDLRALRAVNDVVEGRGALPELGPNGRHVGLVLRLSQELRGYLGQGPHPALCNGVPEMVAFYAEQLAPTDRRAEEVTALARQLRTAAQVRTREIALTELRAYERTLGDLARRSGSALVAVTRTIVEGRTEGLPTVPPLAIPARPAEPASAADFGLLAPATLIREAVRPLLPAAASAPILAEPTPLTMLARARAVLLAPETQREPVPDDVSDAAIAALRLIEASLYADLTVSRHQEVDSTLDGTLRALRDLHGRVCTCREGG